LRIIAVNDLLAGLLIFFYILLCFSIRTALLFPICFNILLLVRWPFGLRFVNTLDYEITKALKA